MLHPEVAYRDCDYCQKYQHNKETGAVILDNFGRPDERYEACPPPCRTSEGCPKGTPENSLALLPQMEDCYRFYLECKAVNDFPKDDWVRMAAVEISQIEREAEQLLESQRWSALMAIASRR